MNQNENEANTAYIHVSSCYIFGAGERFGPPPRPERGDFVIAADGGYEYAVSSGIQADLIVGDFDSLPASALPVDKEIITLPRIKDVTDTQAAISAGWDRGFRRFIIYGGTGGRIDHTLANIQCLADIARRGGRGFLFDRESVITAIHNGGISFPPISGGIVSVFAHGDLAGGVTETGLKYVLSGAALSNACPTGVSNEFIGEKSEITVRNGTLIIVYPGGSDCIISRHKSDRIFSG